MHSIATSIFLKTGSEKNFIALSQNMIDLSRKESYMIWIDMLQMTDDPTQFILYEAFRSETDPPVHLQQSYMQQWITECRGLFSNRVFKVPSHISILN